MKDTLKGLAGYAVMCVLALIVLGVVALLTTAASYAPLVVGGVVILSGLVWLTRGR